MKLPKARKAVKKLAAKRAPAKVVKSTRRARTSTISHVQPRVRPRVQPPVKARVTARAKPKPSFTSFPAPAVRPVAKASKTKKPAAKVKVASASRFGVGPKAP